MPIHIYKRPMIETTYARVHYAWVHYSNNKNLILFQRTLKTEKRFIA